jgi:hypothetical protein
VKKILCGVFLVLALADGAPAVYGQSDRAPAPNSLVRLHRQVPGDTVPVVLSGRLVAITSDSVSLRVSEGRSGSLRTFGRVEIVRFDTGMRRSTLVGAGRGGLIASLVAAPILGMAAAVLMDGGDENLDGGVRFLVGSVYGGILAFPVGAVLGAARPGVRWVPMPLDRNPPPG